MPVPLEEEHGREDAKSGDGQAEFLTYSTHSYGEGLLGAGMRAINAAEENG